MAKTKELAKEREYVVNLRREIMKVPKHKRTPKAVKAMKQFVAKHMRISDRDVKKVKLDKWLNQELWFRGIKNPPTKLKIKVKRDADNVLVSLLELPEKWKFAKEREEKNKKEAEKIKEHKKKEKEEIKREEIKEEKKDGKEEEEKKEAVVEAGLKQAEVQQKQLKHTQVDKQEKTKPRRMALQK
ncbi:MAG: 50S ribosomal protein L31e [Candidatus Pacearchaeota archaeon]